MSRLRKSNARLYGTDKFNGIDTAGEEGGISSPVSIKNFRLTDGRKLQRRCGYVKLCGGIDADTYTSAVIGGKTYFVYKSGTVLTALGIPELDRIECDTKDPARVGYVTFSGELYIYGWRFLYRFDGERFIKTEPYIPTVAITSDKSGAGTVYESLNILSDKAKISYSPDGEATEFILPDNARAVLCVTDGASVCDPEKYRYEAVYHKLTFDTAPSAGVPDSLVVTYALSDGTVTSMPYIGDRFTVYGGARDSRVFAYGNGNTVYYSDVTSTGADPTYFPADNFITVGDGGSRVTSAVRHYDRLLLFTEDQTWSVSPSSVSYDGYSKPSFPLSPLNSSVGSVGGGTAFIDNTPLTLSYDGIYTFGSTAVRDERNAKRISDRVASYISPAFLKNAAVFDNEHSKELFMCFCGTALVYNYGIDAFYTYDNIDAKYMFACGENTAFYNDNGIFMFDEGAYDDDGTPIEAEYESAFLIPDMTEKRRRLRRVLLKVLPHGSADIDVTVCSDLGSSASTVFSLKNVSGFDFGRINMKALSFICGDLPCVCEKRLMLSPLHGIKLIIKSRGGDPFTVYGASVSVDRA